MNNVAYMNGANTFTEESVTDTEGKIQPTKYEERPHTLTSLKSIAKQNEAGVRKMKAIVRQKQAMLARIEKAERALQQLNKTDMALDDTIVERHGQRWVRPR